MLIRKNQNLNEIQTEIFDLLIGFEDEAKISLKKSASKRALAARRAIERHYEDKALARDLNEEWFDDFDD